MQQEIASVSGALLDAGARLARRTSLSRITTAVIATEAGLPSIRFFDAYPDLETFLIDLYHYEFLRPVRAAVEAVIARMPAGIERTQAASQVYLNFCLKGRGLRQWTIEARAQPAFDAAYQRASLGFQALIRNEIKTLGFVDVEGAARLYAAMIYEVTAVEMHDGHENTALRRCLWRLLNFRDRPVLHFPARAIVSPFPLAATTATARQRLLRAGEQLLKNTGDPAALTLEALLAQAHVERDSFDTGFGDLNTFKVALIQSWAEQYMAHCLAAVQGLPPGTERLHAFLMAAWDALIAQRGNRLLMKALLLTDREVRERIASRIQSFTRITALEYQALGVPSAQAVARLQIAASAELGEREEAANAPLPRLRETFWQIFDPLTTGTRAASGKSVRQRVSADTAQTTFLTLQVGDVRGGKPRKRPNARTRAELCRRVVEAGDHLLLSGEPVEQLTHGRLALLAGVEVADAERCYPEFNAYLTDLMMFLLDEARDIAVEATANMEYGVTRLWHGIQAYLDARLDRRATHELSRLLRGYAPAAQASRSRSGGFSLVISTEFRAIGWPDPVEHGHLLTALTSETVQAEHETGRRLPEYRGIIHDFLKRGG